MAREKEKGRTLRLLRCGSGGGPCSLLEPRLSVGHAGRYSLLNETLGEEGPATMMWVRFQQKGRSVDALPGSVRFGGLLIQFQRIAPAGAAIQASPAEGAHRAFVRPKVCTPFVYGRLFGLHLGPFSWVCRHHLIDLSVSGDMTSRLTSSVSLAVPGSAGTSRVAGVRSLHIAEVCGIRTLLSGGVLIGRSA
jgi:hypothetical protein